jgi:hypothetical protein
MNNLLAQIVLAQRRFDDDGWMNILFVVVMAVLWMVGSIVKAMKTKADNQQQTGRSPARKPLDQSRGVRQQSPIQRTQRPAGPPTPAVQTSSVPKKRSTLADLREAARRFAAEAEQSFKDNQEAPKPKPASMPPKQVKAAPKPQVYRETTPEVKPTVAPITGTSGRKDVFAQMPVSQQLSDLVSDYADPEKLRKAILHYEILGPPLSLRD